MTSLLVPAQPCNPVEIFLEWLQHQHAFIHPSIQFVKDPSGLAVHTAENLADDSTIISCPFPVAITPESSKRALSTLQVEASKSLTLLSERELICTYLIVHQLLEDNPHSFKSRVLLFRFKGYQELIPLFSSFASQFTHLPYIKMLPPVSALRTPLHFTTEELSLLRGTNLYGATLDRRAERETEWNRCRNFISSVAPQWEKDFTWERYLTAATYLSSRAFPSTLLSENPSLVATASSYPVLLPGVDSLNHARGHPVSWVITPSSSSPTINQVSLVIRTPTLAGNQLFNNYGPKPNSELILGYGFSLPQNPDDTIVLKIGGAPNSTSGCDGWEIGRYAKGMAGMWEEMKAIITGTFDGGDDRKQGDEDEPMEWEVEMETANTLTDMLAHKMSAIASIPDVPPQNVREDVLEMIRHYVEGQIDILRSLIAFAQVKKNIASQKAAQEGFGVEGGGQL